mgnify:FL=1
MTLENNPSRVDLAKLGSTEVRQELIVENHRRFQDLFRRMEEIFPGVAPTYLTDLRRPAGGKVAFLLDVPPASERPPGSAPLPGDAAPPGAESAAPP